MTPERHPCRWSRTLYIVGPLILLAFCWLGHECYASAVERAELRTKLEGMTEDVSAIRKLLENFSKKP